jgi:Zn finger protein HypA/HybF involved in hydrogenase expression
MGRENSNGDGQRKPGEEVQEKDLQFRCPNCGGNSLKLEGKAHIRLLLTEDLSYASTLDDTVPESERTFRCWDCDFLISDENGPIRRTWALAKWLRENCSQVVLENSGESTASQPLRFVCPRCRGERLDWVHDGVIFREEIVAVAEDNSIVWGRISYGCTDCPQEFYQCYGCDLILEDEEGEAIDREALWHWLKTNCRRDKNDPAERTDLADK